MFRGGEILSPGGRVALTAVTIGSNWTQLNDLTALLGGASGNPPMMGGVRAFNGLTCPWPP